MTIDTVSERVSATGIAQPGWGSFPIPDGSVDTEDRYNVSGGYFFATSTEDNPAFGTFGDYSLDNANATAVESNYEICDRTGAKARVGELVSDWNGLLVKPKFRDGRHPQEFVRSRREVDNPPKSPEPDDIFLSTNEISVDDL